MILRAYSIYDRKALAYHPPFFQATDGSATRSFADLANDTTTMVGRHPNDYVLFCIGSYDDSKGLLVGMSPVQHVVDGQAVVKQNQPLFVEQKTA